MTIVNKWVLSTFEFSYTNTLLLWQNAATIVMLQVLSGQKLIRLEAFEIEKARRLLPLSLAYTANVFCALTALSLTSVPVYNALKRTTPLTTMAVDYILRGVRFSWQVQV
jgi:drug/metabolite transporter (DMT)-like permease